MNKQYVGMYYEWAGNMHYICSVNVDAGLYQWQWANADGSFGVAEQLGFGKHINELSDIALYKYRLLTREQVTSGWE